MRYGLWRKVISMPTIAHLIHVYGLFFVAVVIGLESVGMPFPGETVLIFASVDAGTKHDLNIASVILTAAGASIIGRMIGHVIGRNFGYWVLLRYGGYLRITESRIKLGQYLFLRHGGKIVLIAQFLPVLRSVAGILAGANRMPWPHFMLTNIIGAFLWATFYALAAYSLGWQAEQLGGWMVFVLGLGLLIFIVVAASSWDGMRRSLRRKPNKRCRDPLSCLNQACRAAPWPPSDRAGRSFGEPATDRSKKISGLLPLALRAPRPRHAHRRA